MGPVLKAKTNKLDHWRRSRKKVKNDDYHFFQSLVPHLTSLPLCRKLQIKNKIQELILFEMKCTQTFSTNQHHKNNRINVNIAPMKKHAEMQALRATNGEFNVLYKNVRKNEDSFFMYLQMSIKTFDIILFEIEEQLRDGAESKYKASISPEERLVITLKHLNTGDSTVTLSSRFLIGRRTVYAIISQTCEILWNTLKNKYMPIPSTEEWLGIAKRFFDECNFPNCIGAISGKYIHIKYMPHGESRVRKYVNGFILLHLIVDAEGKIITIEIDTEEWQRKSESFKNSRLFHMLESNNLNIPTENEIPNTDIKIPFVFVGDQEYPLLNCLMTPFPGKNISDNKKPFNQCLSKAFRNVDHTFSIMESKWKILQKSITTSVDHTVAIINAISILHNVVMAHEPFRMPLNEANSNLQNKKRRKMCNQHEGKHKFASTAFQTRQILADYFNRLSTMPEKID